MPDTITLTGDYRYSDYTLRNSDADVIDASDASWTVANIGSNTNPYPFQIVGADADLTILGGTINGEVSLTLDWQDAYVNSVALRIENAPRVTIEDWRISRPWDGIRLKGSSNGFTIENVWLSDVRDDAIENDDSLGGTVRDSLFDGVFVGISTDGDLNGSGNTVTLDGLLMRMKPFLYKGEVTHQSPFKANKDGGNPSFRVIDSIIAIERVNHEGMERLEVAFDQMTEVRGSHYLNLSNTALPSSYLNMIPDGFTILQGQAARDFWTKARAEFVNKFDSGGGSSGPEPTPTPEPTPDPTPDPDPDPAPTPDPDPTAPGTGVANVRIAASADDVEEDRSGQLDFTSSDLELADEGASNPGQTIGLRFNELDIPKGAVITRAYVQFQVDEANSGTANLRIRGHDTDDAAAFTSSAFNVSSRATTSASVAWNPSAWTQVGEAGANQRTTDISSIVQEIVSRSGWQADNALALIITGSGQRTAEAYNGNTTAAPLLHVEWNLPGSSGTPNPPPPSPTPSPINAIVGTGSSETLRGTSGADDISARGGNDLVYGKGGNDILTGGQGRDYFVFDIGPGAGNVDVITDFTPGTDRLYLDNSVFTQLGSGSLSSPRMLSSSYFEVGSRAGDSNDYIVHNRSTGDLYYDADGSRSGAAVKFAEIGDGLNLDYDDIFVI